MVALFSDQPQFNEDISEWDTASATAMDRMFEGAINFNRDITCWRIAATATVAQMFANATAWLQAFKNLHSTNYDGPPGAWSSKCTWPAAQCGASSSSSCWNPVSGCSVQSLCLPAPGCAQPSSESTLEFSLPSLLLESEAVGSAVCTTDGHWSTTPDANCAVAAVGGPSATQCRSQCLRCQEAILPSLELVAPWDRLNRASSCRVRTSHSRKEAR